MKKVKVDLWPPYIHVHLCIHIYTLIYIHIGTCTHTQPQFIIKVMIYQCCGRRHLRHKPFLLGVGIQWG